MKAFKITIFIAIFASVSSCFFDKKTDAVDAFYTKRIYLDFPVLPLSKPIFICYVKSYDEWGFEIPNTFKNSLSINGLNDIGVDKTFIYGKILGKKRKLNKYNDGDNVYMYVDGSVTWTKDIKTINDNIIKITSFDTVNKSFIEPERWFVINVADSTTEAFFSRKKYEDYLTEKEISGKMYDINKYHKQYKETGVLPWFPDSIKVKLKK